MPIVLWLHLVMHYAINYQVRQKEPTPGGVNFRLEGALISFDPEEFLALLNGESIPLSLPFLGVSKVDVSLPFLDVSNVRAQLLVYVNDWLNTGVGKDGVEDPRARDLTRAADASRAIRRFAHTRAVELEVVPNGVSVRFRGYASMTISDLMQNLSRPRGKERDAADRLLAVCCLSGWLRKLGKCRRCSKYFELKHWNRVYKRGTACCGCARVRSAVLSTSKARHEAEEALIRMIAKQFRKRVAKDPKWYRDATLKARIMAFAESRIAGNDSLRSVYRHSLTGKWLSWAKNRIGIERVAKGSTDAES